MDSPRSITACRERTARKREEARKKYNKTKAVRFHGMDNGFGRGKAARRMGRKFAKNERRRPTDPNKTRVGSRRARLTSSVPGPPLVDDGCGYMVVDGGDRVLIKNTQTGYQPHDGYGVEEDEHAHRAHRDEIVTAPPDESWYPSVPVPVETHTRDEWGASLSKMIEEKHAAQMSTEARYYQDIINNIGEEVQWQQRSNAQLTQELATSKEEVANLRLEITRQAGNAYDLLFERETALEKSREKKDELQDEVQRLMYLRDHFYEKGQKDMVDAGRTIRELNKGNAELRRRLMKEDTEEGYVYVENEGLKGHKGDRYKSVLECQGCIDREPERECHQYTVGVGDVRMHYFQPGCKSSEQQREGWRRDKELEEACDKYARMK